MTGDIKKMQTLMLRLEAVAARLEDVAGSNSLQRSTVCEASSPESASLTEQGSRTAPEPLEELQSIVKEFDLSTSPALTKFSTLSDSIGAAVAEIARVVVDSFLEQRRIIEIAGRSKQSPVTSPAFQKLLVPLQSRLGKINDMRESNRASPYFNHLSTVADGIAALGWVAITPAPAPYIGDMKDSAQFYGNRIIKEFKETDQNHVQWARSFFSLLSELQNYVKAWHTTGLVWNQSGGDLIVLLESAQTEKTERDYPANTQSLPPPPPPGPPPAPSCSDAPSSQALKTDMNSVFADLNKGSSVTAGLRKVDSTQMTHKNPSLRESSVVPIKTKTVLSNQDITSVIKEKLVTLPAAKATRIELEGSKWFIENFRDTEQVTLDKIELNHSIYIYNCRNTTIKVHGKFNALSIDGCVKVGLVVDTLVSSIDLVKCNSFAVQVLDKCPTIICDVCDSGQIYLSESGSECEIVTSKCGSINVNIDTGDGEFREEAVPEMLKHHIVDGRLETSIVIHAD